MHTKFGIFLGFMLTASQTIGMNSEPSALEKCRTAASNAVGTYYNWEQSNSKLTTEPTGAAVNRITLSTQENNPQNIHTKLEDLAKKLKSRVERVKANKLLSIDVPMNPQQFNNFKALHSKVEEELRNCQSAMTMSETQSKKLSPTEKNAHKMMLFNDALKRHEDLLKKEGEVQKDIRTVVEMKLHEVSNPVLDGTLVFINPKTKEKSSFKIKDLAKKDGTLDLSNKVFGNITNDIKLAITTNPSAFFNKHDNKIMLMIAPWSLIHDNLKTSTAPFEPIMANWDKTTAPIGFFWKPGYTDDILYNIPTDLSKSTLSLGSILMESRALDDGIIFRTLLSHVDELRMLHSLNSFAFLFERE